MKVLMVGVPKTKRTGGVATHTEELVKNLRKLGIKVEIYKISPTNEYPVILDYLIKLHRRTLGLSIYLLKNYRKFDVTHIQSSGPAGGFIPAIVGAFWKTLLGFSLVVTFHYSKTEQFLRNNSKVLQYALKRVEKFIVVAHRQKNLILSKIGERFKDKIVVIPNGYDPNKFKVIKEEEARQRLRLSSTDRVLVNVALLLEKKGQRYIIEAINIIVHKKRMSNIKCFIIGDGPLYDRLQQQIKYYDLENNIKLTGYVSSEKLTLFLNSADIFVLPSLNEGNPTVMFEALGVGLPFVGTKVGGVPEIIISEDYGLLVEPANPEDLAEKILIALDKEWNSEKIKKYAKQFTWENIGKRTVKVYEKIKQQ